jgi:purine-binding chemotaxis protein CheW
MMSASGKWSAASLRAAFDASFARSESAGRAESEDYLLIRIGGDRFALPLASVAALLADRKIAPVPSPTPGLLGIIGLRGAIAPVHDLGRALGFPPAAAPRWLFLARAADPIAFAFDQFEAHVRILAGSLAEDGGDAHARPHLRGSLSTSTGVYPVIHLQSLLQAIAPGGRAEPAPKER